MKGPWRLLLGLAICTAATAAEMDIDVVPLRYRSAADVIPVLQPLLAPGGTLTGMNNQLVIKTTAENHAEIMAVLERIDLQLRRLVITVRNQGSQQVTADRQSAAARYDDGTVVLRAGSGEEGRRGVGVGVQGDDVSAAYRYQGHDERVDEGGDFRLQTVEGQAAFIEAGQSLPLPQRTVTTPNGRVVVQDTVEYRDARSGFWVLPRLSGDQVTLLVSPYTSRAAGGRTPVFDVGNAETTVSGRLGEWLEIGGIDRRQARSEREVLGAGNVRGEEHSTISVRVEEIR